MGEGTKIGTDTDILLSSFNATDVNHDNRGTETRAGFRFSKPSVFPLRAGGLLRWTGMGSQARGGLELEA